MRLNGGYNIRLSNPPAGEISVLELPERLYLSRYLPGVYFDEAKVQPGTKISAGAVLAQAVNGMPMLSPLAGLVEAVGKDQIVMAQLTDAPAVCDAVQGGVLDIVFFKGCFRYITDIKTGEIAGKASKPAAIFVRLADLDNYVMAGEVELMGSASELAGGLKLLAGLTDGKLYVVVTKEQAGLGKAVMGKVGDVGAIELLTIPARYGLDNPRLLADKLGIGSGEVVWSLPPQGVLAVERAVNAGRASTSLLLSVSGPGVKQGRYYKLPVGYPIAELLKGNLATDGPVRLINGGVMTGREIPAGQVGLPSDITGLTVLNNKPTRKLLKFAWFGLEDGRFYDNLSTDMQGELRACVSCGYCQKYCPAGLLPDYLHKQLYADNLDQARHAGLDKCVHCGICSFVCVSKIDLTEQFVKAQAVLAEEDCQSNAEGGR